MVDGAPSLVPIDLAGAVRWLPVAFVLALAVLFGRTLAPGQTPLIERIARMSLPAMPIALRRYTHGLTALWCAWFVGAAVGLAWWQLPLGLASGLVWAGTLVLFVGERLLRPLWFPGVRFPGFIQQLRDTWRVWRQPA